MRLVTGTKVQTVTYLLSKTPKLSIMESWYPLVMPTDSNRTSSLTVRSMQCSSSRKGRGLVRRILRRIVRYNVLVLVLVLVFTRCAVPDHNNVYLIIHHT